MTGIELLFVFLGVFLLTAIFFKVPVAYSLGISCSVMFLVKEFNTANMATAFFNANNSFPFLAIPMFVFAGDIMKDSRISLSLVSWLQFFFRRVKGSLGIITILAAMGFGVLTGSIMATISAIGKIMSPALEGNGYKKGYIGALLASVSFLGVLIPPSIPGILYAQSANLNTAHVWISTIGPAIIFCLGYIGVNYIVFGRKEKLPVLEKVTPLQWSKIAGLTTVNAIPALVMPVVVFGGIYGGICTPTEAGAISVVYGLSYFMYKKIRYPGTIKESVFATAVSAGITTGTICIIIAFAMVTGRAITMGGVSSALTSWLVANIGDKYVYLLLVNILYLFLGMILDVSCNILLMTPLLLPAAVALGVDPIHFGAITLVNFCVGNITPPFASSIFVAARIVDVSFLEIVKYIWPFLIVAIVVILITTYVPWVSLCLVPS
jgi:C4-dicarboxylate transporter DctM subunit